MYGLIGKTLKHSYSKEIHSFLGLKDYQLFELDEQSFIKKIRNKNYVGLNITIPYKQAAIEYMDVIDENAKEIGAINTIVNKNGVLYGYNTDYYGFEYLIKKHNINVMNKKILVLGNGGVSKPVILYLRRNKANYFIVNRYKKSNIINYEEALKFHNDASIIINTSPVGMYPNINDSPMELKGYNNLSIVIDLIANPKETKLMKLSMEKSITVYGGIEMLVAQAKKTEELFFSTEIPDNKIDEITVRILELMDNKSKAEIR
jgi:shikimate dehydrogenase